LSGGPPKLVQVDWVFHHVDALEGISQVCVRALSHALAHGDHAGATDAGGAAVERKKEVALGTMALLAGLPGRGLIVRVVNRADDGNARQSAGESAHEVRLPEVGVHERHPPAGQELPQPAHRAWEIATGPHSQGLDRNTERFDGRAPVIRRSPQGHD